ncbi:RING/U-box protein [Rhynchospora pubera]|uniref:RING/U-box protein n=1 Tax=Rhynchospora pubera TaxID=906938 RepID=A0AAV8EQQ8_9POAL|nr:RING/U-box protein [Rhynchospora pubera]
MELEENSDLVSIGVAFGAKDNLEDATLNGEVCVICTGVVTERGVLDCCQHWFCYECIEQWAAFSNHCPICKIDFHSITFLPVDDTSNCTEGGESSLLIEGDDWYIKEGENDTLFFPANYISEENVKCLDEAGCKIRSGLATYGDSISDTSVACDSCENWYHAICVDFDPNDNCSGGWICPRCASDPSQVKQVSILKDSPKPNFDGKAGDLAASSLPGNVSVSIDDGETAVVVSFHKGSMDNWEQGRKSESELLLKESEMFPKDEKFPLVLSPIHDPVPEESACGESNLRSGTNEEIKVKVCDGSVALESKPAVSNEPLHDIDMVDTTEERADNLVRENLSNVSQSQKPIELRGQTTKRRYLESMMEPVAVSKKAKLASTNIMSIVTELSPRTSNKDKVNTGVRTRTIMRNQIGDKKPSDVDKLQTEIKTLKDSINDDSLLRAVRTVIATNKAGPSSVRVKRPTAQTGKARQNLMKKIYSTSTGRRRPAWQRDCEVEFWKYRCNSKVDQEKVENLQSILDLLKKGSTWSELCQGPELCQGQNEKSKDSILSRVYLADASVLPRKDDIKPLSDVSGASVEKCNQDKPENGDKSRVVPVKKENKITVGKGLSNQDKNENHSGETKVDKRKWALEVLARKNASLESGANKERSQDGLLLKGNYPLLAQLPVDMRPVLMASRHNKVPVSVRQAQLYRIAEQFLRASGPSNCHSAETELAVADAINIEKEICERSNSKLVYLNLVSQSLRQHTNKSTLDTVENIQNVGKSECVDGDGDMEQANDDVEKANDGDAEKALRMAGLLSDSPPNSPERNDYSVENNTSLKGETALVCTETEEMQDGQRKEPGIECIGSDHPESERGKKKLEDNIDPTIESSISDQKADSGIPKTNSVVVKASENEVADGKTAFVRETGDKKNYDWNKHVNKDSDDNNSRRDDCKDGCESEGESCAGSKSILHNRERLTCSPSHSMVCENAPKEDKTRGPVNQKPSDSALAISKKVEAYVKEHIRPLCKSGVISVGQYRWAVGKTTEKVMKYHQKDKSASFLIKEGEKVKKLAEQYVESAQKMADL